MAGETVITVVGNLVDDPELRFTPSGAAVANFRIASTLRVLRTLSGPIHPRRAVPIPKLICRPSASARWQSLLTTSVTPAAAASRAIRPSMSR